ncbi:hypothetical protein [Phormidium nigroviride]
MDMIKAIWGSRRAIASKFNYSDRSHPLNPPVVTKEIKIKWV